jgi:hypothetical protein
MTPDESMAEAVGGGEEAPPEGHYWADIKERRVLVKNLTPAQAMALGGMMQRTRGPQGDDYATNLDILGKLQLLLENLIVRREDRDWLEMGILTDTIKIEDFRFVFVGRDLGADARPAKKPRRGR